MQQEFSTPSLPPPLDRMPPHLLNQLLTEAAQTAKQTAGRKPWRSIARPDQILPAGDWLTWLILAGRGWGKTRTGAEAVREWSKDSPRISIIAPTYADARDTCVEGDSGLKTICDPGEIEKWNRSLGELEFRNGCKVKLFSSDEPERLRGPQHYKLWADELGAWKYPRETWDMAMFGLRLGVKPQAIVTTTPKPIDVIRELLAKATTHVTKGNTYANRANLAASFFEQIVSRYEGTRLGRQEINAELLEDVPGALWTRDMVDRNRVSAIPELLYVVVGVDPATTSRDTSDEAGIVVAGKGADGHGYVLADYTMRGRPREWASEAISAFNKHKANMVVAEGNNGGEMVEDVISLLCKSDGIPKPAYEMVWAAEGKRTRAEPASALYEQNECHHVGSLTQLEDEQCSWVPLEGASPNRIDALVWALHKLGLIKQIDAKAVPNPFYD